MHDRPLPRVTRRALLVGSGTLVLTGALAACTSGAANDPNAPAPTGEDDPDFELRTSVIAAEAALIAHYNALIKKHPDLKKRLTVFRDHHAQHLDAVNTAGALPVPTPQGPQIPASAAAALRALAAAEQAAAAARAANCLAASRWQFSRELSLIGGCEAAHHYLLGEEA